MRRILIFVLVVTLIGGGVWYFFIRTRTDTTGNTIPPVFQSFFPIHTTNNGTSGVDENGNASAELATKERFTQLTTRPVAGFSIFALETTLTIPNNNPLLKPTVTTVLDHYLRYVSRANGYVFESKNGAQAVQVSNIFIPNIYEASFADNNNTALLRFLKPDDQTIATYSVAIPPLNSDGTRTQKQGLYLPDNITSLIVSPDSKQIARLTTEQSGALISTSATTNATAKKDIIRTPFSEWLLSWPDKNNIYVQTKASSEVLGYFYRIDTAANRLRRFIGGVAGLTTSISPTGNYVLYSESTVNGFVTRIFNTKTAVTTPISLSILPEKCAWYTNDDLLCAGNSTVPEAVYPDSWYAGLTHFQDQLYYINTGSNTYNVVYDGTDRLFDMTALQIDEGKNLLYFIDKSTGLLWKLTL